MKSITKTILDNCAINKISESVFGEELLSSKELTGGFFNAAYEIITQKGRQSILKVAPSSHVRVMGYEKDIMSVEVDVMKLLTKKTTIPIPKVFAHDKSMEIIPQEYYVMEKLEGEPYNIKKNTLEIKQQKLIEEKLGEYNKQINSIKSDSFGLFSNSQLRYENWYDCFLALVEMILKDGQYYNVDIGASYQETIDLVKSLKDILSVVKQARLVHWDLWDGNVFVKESKVTGITDFERTLWGDNIMEVYFYSSEDEHFKNGYHLDATDKKYFDIRKSLYGFYMFLCMVVECPYRQYTEDISWRLIELNSKREKLISLINKI